jgi:hypothetical protein
LLLLAVDREWSLQPIAVRRVSVLEDPMTRYISTLPTALLLLSAFLTSVAWSEDMLKKDLMDSLIATGAKSVPTPTGGTKADCVQKAEQETDATKKSELMKICDAMK